MDNKNKSYAIAGIFIAYTIILFWYYPSIILSIATSGFLMGAMLYLITNPAYILLIYFIIENARRKGKSAIKAAIASLLIVFSFDIISSPRISISELSSFGASTITNMGGIAIKSMVNFGLSPIVAWYMYYLVIPILLFVVSMELLSFSNFIKNFKRT